MDGEAFETLLEVHPVLAARLTASLDRISGGRVNLQKAAELVLTYPQKHDLRAGGDRLHRFGNRGGAVAAGHVIDTETHGVSFRA